MKYLFLLLCAALVVFSCKDENGNRYSFESARLVGDSVNLVLRMNEPQTLLTTEGEMSIHFLGSELCSQEECSTCDVSASVNIFLVHAADTVKVSPIRLYRCSQDLPILYKTINCSQADFGSYGYHFTKYGRIIYSVSEMYPYPATRAEVMEFAKNNRYSIKVTALNSCIQ